MKKGFTLIELVFIIVILGIMAAVAIPKLKAVSQNSAQNKVIQEDYKSNQLKIGGKE